MKLFFAALFWLLALSPQQVRQEDSLRRAKMYELFMAGDKDGVLAESRSLVDFHLENGSEKQLFDAYASLFERQQMWGLYDEAVATLEEMSSQAGGRPLGTAITEFCFGQLYLGNRQPQEAEGHYRRAFRELSALGENGRALRAGLNLQAVAINLNELEKGLGMNDSTAFILEKIERKNGKLSVPNRLKQSRYRFVLLQRLGRMEEARPLKDTLLHYAAIINDPSQDEMIYTAVAQFEQQDGRKEAAYALLDTLVQRQLRNGNYAKAAQHRLALADFQKDNGDLALAVDNYRLYAAENDSAQVHLTNEQLNELTKRFQLNELKQENAAARQRMAFLTLVLVLLAAIALGSLFYARILRRKNRMLYKASREEIHAEEASEQHLSQEPQTPEERLYASLLGLMHDEQLFQNPKLGRDELSARLGTNRTYLSDAIRQCSGFTVSGFINHYRLRWAAEALSGRPDLSIQAIGEDAGFGGRSTFYRLFQEQYGMSPSAYRTAAGL